jgi:hypothetical protein
VSTHALAALVRFQSEARRPLYDRDLDVMRGAILALEPYVQSSPNVRRALAHLADQPDASANEVALHIGGRRKAALAAAREAKRLLGTNGNHLGGDPAAISPDSPLVPVAEAQKRARAFGLGAAP